MAYAAAANDLPLLVAPRPVRLTAHHAHMIARSSRLVPPSDPSDRQKITDMLDHDDPAPELDRDLPPSARTSPRSALPSEALEEFLSILRPSFFPPTSPNIRTRRSVPPFQYERPFTFKQRARFENLDPDSAQSVSPAPEYVDVVEFSEGDMPVDSSPPRWFTSGVLSSPISRMHTRNPFLRHASNQSPGPISPLSPAAIPLPLPTADEMNELP